MNKAVERPYTILGSDVSRVVDTGAAGEEMLSSFERRQQELDSWEEIVDTFVTWGLQGSGFEDDGVIPPSPVSIVTASRAVAQLRERVKPPSRFVMSGDGGIVFEWHDDVNLTTLEIDSEGSCEVAMFTNSRLRERRRRSCGDPFDDI